MRDYHLENLSHDPVHGYIPFTSSESLAEGEVSERQIIDHPWVQRLRQIRQLQTAWWVFPSAEHSRFPHVLGVMHLASRTIAGLYESLCEHCGDVPSRGYVESLLRMAGLLHDVGHGPFGHFFDAHFLRRFGLTHETLGAHIIRRELGELLCRIRRNPHSQLAENETLCAEQIAWLIQRPQGNQADAQQPKWLVFLRGLLSGIYTIDNMDFVLRDAYMTGYSQKSFDLDRLLHYTFFSDRGLTIHEKGVDSLIRFMGARAELFRTVYFHRTVRAIDLALADLFQQSQSLLLPGDPREHLDAYLNFTEHSLMIDAARWSASADPQVKAIGELWRPWLARQVQWRMVCQRNLVFAEGDREGSSLFNSSEDVERALRRHLPDELQSLPLRIDIARHIFRPHTSGPSTGQNFLFDAARSLVRPLTTNELFKRLPVSHRICRIYAQTSQHDSALAAALDLLLGGPAEDDVTNM